MRKSVFVPVVMISALMLLAGTVSADSLETKNYILEYGDQWTVKPDSLKTETVTMQVLNGEKADFEVYISVCEESVLNYRRYLRSYGFDEYELAVNNAYELHDIAGIDCLMRQRNATKVDYVGRDVDRGLTMYLTVTGDLEDACIDELLSGIQITAEGTGNVDYLWYWEGERFPSGSYAASLESLSLKAENLAFEDPMRIYSLSSGRIAAAGDSIYVLKDDTLFRCKETDGMLTIEDEYTFDYSYSEMQGCSDGKVYLSSTSKLAPVAVFDEAGNKTELPCESYTISMHPSGEWGVCFFTGTTLYKVTIEDGKVVNGADYEFPEDLKSVSRVYVTEDHIFVAGTSLEKGKHCVFVLDLDGNYQMKLGDVEMKEPGFIAYVYAMAETDAGYAAFDGNMKTVVFWDKEGNPLGQLKGSEIFGANYAWMTGCTLDQDGSIIVSMEQERDDRSGSELLVYRLHGFGTEKGAEAEAVQEAEPVVPDVDFTSEAVVIAVQNALNAAGYDCGTADGKAGKKTYAALNAFQLDHDLTVVNEISAEVYAALGLN